MYHYRKEVTVLSKPLRWWGRVAVLVLAVAGAGYVVVFLLAGVEWFLG